MILPSRATTGPTVRGACEGTESRSILVQKGDGLPVECVRRHDIHGMAADITQHQPCPGCALGQPLGPAVGHLHLAPPGIHVEGAQGGDTAPDVIAALEMGDGVGFFRGQPLPVSPSRWWYWAHLACAARW